MPVGRRLRDNGVLGTTLDNPLTAGATTFNSVGLASLGVVAGDHAIITLDPLRQNGNSEIIIVTNHTSAATVATITRAAYGTIARSHPLGTLWLHSALDEDFIEVLTAATRPSNPYEGQFIFETDTNKLVGYGGVDWAPRDAGGQLANGYAQVVANQAGMGAGPTDLTGLSVSVTVGTGRRVRVTGYTRSLESTVAGDAFSMNINEGAVQLQRSHVTGVTANRGLTMQPVFISTPSAGAHTYKLTVTRDAGSGTITLVAGSDAPSFILVEDIGAA